MIDAADRQNAAPQPGYVTRTLLRWLMRPARIAAVKPLSAHFRLIDIEGDALKDIAWAVGQKLQIAMGTGMTTRTYTPISWEAGQGRTRLLAFAHGDGPGSRWIEGLRQGDACQFFGPRRSLDFSGLAAPLVLFGDETSFALAAALRAAAARGVTCLFEVGEIAESRSVLEATGLGDATLIERVANNAHLGEIATKVAELGGSGASFVLTGKAQSIQHVSRALKTMGVGPSRVKAKAYWAPGKTGLD